MKNVELIAGCKNLEFRSMRVFSEESIGFASELSKILLKSSVLKAYPDLKALGFWCRRTNLQKYKESCPEANYRLGRGMCFHVAPSNIPISFAFSYLFALLAGCSSVVRLPSRYFSQVDAFVSVYNELIDSFPEIKKRTQFVRYPADNCITEEFSKKADIRMIWGGDATVNNIRSLKCKPKCIDVSFADRYSFCIIDGERILKCSEEVIKRLADDFYNDTYLMDQNACSSPMLVCWLNDSLAARQRFWDSVYFVAEKKYYLQDEICVDKYLKSCEDSIDRYENILEIKNRTNLLYRVEIKNLISELENYRGKCGYFYEYSMRNITDIIPAVTEKFQTATYFGVDPENIRNVVLKSNLPGIDRIVPVGKALDIGFYWDGYDLIRILSRLVYVE